MINRRQGSSFQFLYSAVNKTYHYIPVEKYIKPWRGISVNFKSSFPDSKNMDGEYINKQVIFKGWVFLMVYCAQRLLSRLRFPIPFEYLFFL